ncbi:MAG TPA: hypothetical protein VGF69_25035 [Thermoanaerobaculia bacterium]|jgi:uncharacterized protein (DUF983 family)
MKKVSRFALIRTVLARGWKRRCFRCGVGPLFQRTIVTYDRCPACGVLYQRNYGDIWMYVIFMDRIPIGLGVVAVYFGFQSATKPIAIGFFLLMFIPLIATIRQRQGVAIAIDYLSRIWFPDPSDEIHDGRGAVINL